MINFVLLLRFVERRARTVRDFESLKFTSAFVHYYLVYSDSCGFCQLDLVNFAGNSLRGILF